MLRLHVFCTPISGYREIKIGDTRHSSWLVQDQKEWRILRNVSVRALRDESNEGVRGLPGQRWDPGLEIEVPFEQRPVNEYSSLKDETLYSWAELSPGSFLIKLGGLWLTTFIVLGLPIAAASFNPAKEPLRLILAAGTGTLFLTSLIILRIYLGWSYVGDRLLSAVIPYEESGWYDGQMWVKPPEILARDRLLGSYKVKPVIKMLKQTLVGTGTLLVSGVLLFIFATPVENFFHATFTTEDISPAVRATNINTKFNIRKEELLRLPVDVKEDDDLAAAAAEAADGRPVYCRNRLYRALAGGQYCKWEDLLR
ncbi:protein CONSERVED IN THE GREEN LINEAGE AND DIATOMS 27, chloroplastic [Silene latifolia]|uniref:protein CONSERVED IN THE GREEN LINEAGE AND DIATOMS 27, chloroplastic n=1 Tax=Silene latifolia TaxID=37657 RepID=UPI003D77E46F